MTEATRPRSGRRETRKQQTRDRICDAGVRLFVEQGYDETSVEQITEAADVARQTFFNHFPAKRDIVHAWVERRRSEVGTGLEAGSGADAITRLTHGLRAVAAVYDSDAQTSRPMVRFWVRHGGPLLPGADATAELFQDVISAGQVAGQVRPGIDPALAAHVLLDVYLGRLCSWAVHGGNLWQQLQPAVAIVLHALRPTSDAAAGP